VALFAIWLGRGTGPVQTWQAAASHVNAHSRVSLFVSSSSRLYVGTHTHTRTFYFTKYTKYNDNVVYREKEMEYDEAARPSSAIK
jgi:hypothetical protein